jgi:hypothetical protein
MVAGEVLLEESSGLTGIIPIIRNLYLGEWNGRIEIHN